MRLFTYLIFLVLLSCSYVVAQERTISGVVKDHNTNEPIPFTSIRIKGTYNGKSTDVNGSFSIKTVVGDTLSISTVGYITSEIVIDKSTSKTLQVLLKENVVSLQAVTVKPKLDVGKEILKKIIKNKDLNAAEISSISNYKTISNTTIYLASDSASVSQRLVDTLLVSKSDSSGLVYVPIFLSEEATNITNGTQQKGYINKNGIFPNLNQTIERLISQYLVVDLDFYRNQIYIFDRGFISPISGIAPLHYNIYFHDSTFIDSSWYYNFSFIPKNKYSPLFTGHFSVDREKLALSRIEVYFKKEANVNFVSGFKGIVAYSEQPDGKLFLSNQQVSINLSIFQENDSANQYTTQRINNISEGDWLLNKTTNYSTSSRLDKIEASKWIDQPEFQLKEVDSSDYQQVDHIQKQPLVKSIDAVGGMALTSYMNLKVMEIGPVFDIYSTNEVEGYRFTIPLRTGEEVFQYLTLGGFAGYGTKSKEIKYGANMGWQPLKSDKYVLRFSYANDYRLISQDKFLRFIKKNPNTRGNGNFIAALTSRERNPFLKEEKSFEARIEFNAERNLDFEFSPYFNLNYSTPEVHFIRNDIEYSSYRNIGVLINLRLAFGQHYDKLYFARIYYLTQVPVINISVDIGQVQLNMDHSESFGIYAHLHGSIQGAYNMGQISMRYMVNGGYLFGDAPYELLEMPTGSMSLGYAKYQYNLLHQASFAHNLYTNAHLEFSGGGIILNRLPLIRRLKLREMLSLKSHYGSLGNHYKAIFELPLEFSNKLSVPYAEIGIGLSNIFKFFRVEYVHEISNYYSTLNISDKHGIRFRAELSF